LSGETEVLGETLPQCHFVHLKPHMTYLGSHLGCSGGKPATNRLSYGTASGWLYVEYIKLKVYIEKSTKGVARNAFLVFVKSAADFIWGSLGSGKRSSSQCFISRVDAWMKYFFAVSLLLVDEFCNGFTRLKSDSQSTYIYCHLFMALGLIITGFGLDLLTFLYTLT
jgi:hypothetical protein